MSLFVEDFDLAHVRECSLFIWLRGLVNLRGGGCATFFDQRRGGYITFLSKEGGHVIIYSIRQGTLTAHIKIQDFSLRLCSIFNNPIYRKISRLWPNRSPWFCLVISLLPLGDSFKYATRWPMVRHTGSLWSDVSWSCDWGENCINKPLFDFSNSESDVFQALPVQSKKDKTMGG